MKKQVLNAEFLKFTNDFLYRLRRIFNHLAPGAIKETRRHGVLYFNLREYNSWVCICNVYPGGVQLILKQSARQESLKESLEYSMLYPPDWMTVLNLIMDLLDKLRRVP